VSAKQRAPRCDLTGTYAADGWKNRKGWRCTNDAAWRSSGGTLFCEACRKHGKDLAQAEINLANRQLLAIKTAKRIRRGGRR
jgi:hypothetical protein